ncbi:hypothetical protein ACFLTJ_04095, partial [Chloroflexota bacterium]
NAVEIVSNGFGGVDDEPIGGGYTAGTWYAAPYLVVSLDTDLDGIQDGGWASNWDVEITQTECSTNTADTTLQDCAQTSDYHVVSTIGGYVSPFPLGTNWGTWSEVKAGAAPAGGVSTLGEAEVAAIELRIGYWGNPGLFAGPVVSGVGAISVNGQAYSAIEPDMYKSEDDGFTWTSLTDNVQDAANLPADFISLTHVSVAQDDVDWLAVAGYLADGTPAVVASQDGGSNFSYTGDIVDGGVAMQYIYDLAVSIEVDGVHNIALAGMSDTGAPGLGTIFRLEAGTWLGGSWKDTADYTGWDNGVTGNAAGVVAIAFSPNFDIDDTIVIIGINGVGSGVAYLQSGTWEGGNGAWNNMAGFPNAVEIVSNGDTLLTGVYQRSCGLALPDDYDGSDPGSRAHYVYVNAYNTITTLTGGFLMRVDDGSVSEPYGPSGNPLFASIDFHGDADTGKMMIGEYIRWDNDDEPPTEGNPIIFDCCAGVRVWHTVELDPCCPDWELACKNPSGPYMALVTYTPDGEKSHASTSGALDMEFPGFGFFAGLCDESAFSVSFDDGVSFNQVGLIDTDIDYLSDVAVCPDCSTIYLSTINVIEEGQVCECDSVWRSYDDGDTWERIFHGDWADDDDDELLLRLPCDAIEDCCDQDPVTPSGTLYLGIQGTNDIFYSRDCGQCWNDPPATKIEIQDFAVESENIVYVLDENGDFSMSTQYGRRWSDAVDTGMDSGHSITSCCDEGFIVAGGFDGDPVAWSDDGGESWNTTDDVPIDGEVHVACDPVCPNIVYAAVDRDCNDGGIYRTDIIIGSWDNLTPVQADYTGIVVANEGTLYAATDHLISDANPQYGVCDSTRFMDSSAAEIGDIVTSGVARNLDPCETACCGDESWDYLICGLNPMEWDDNPKEYFDAQPTSLRICGCLSTDTNSVLWAIDTQDYDVENGSGSDPGFGQLWSYEDCAAKVGPTLLSPADGDVLDCAPCAGCDPSTFT